MTTPATQLGRAIAIAVMAHAGQLDKAGKPYISHPLRVMAAVDGLDAKTVAVLHDVVEDTPVTLDVLAAEFPPAVIAALDALSRRDGEVYAAFIERVAQDSLATQVKLADLADNLAPERAASRPVSLERRYLSARARLTRAYLHHVHDGDAA